MADPLRIVGGAWKGRALVAPANKTRPTLSRRRETLFDLLRHGKGARDFVDRVVLDLFAGAGALGFEALSRGASRAIFMDSDTDALRAIRTNAERLGARRRTHILRRDARRIGRRSSFLPLAALVFADPPYGSGLGAESFAALKKGGWLAPAARLVLEEDAQDPSPAIDGLALLESRLLGRTRFRIFAADP